MIRRIIEKLQLKYILWKRDRIIKAYSKRPYYGVERRRK